MEERYAKISGPLFVRQNTHYYRSSARRNGRIQHEANKYLPSSSKGAIRLMIVLTADKRIHNTSKSRTKDDMIHPMGNESVCPFEGKLVFAYVYTNGSLCLSRKS